MKKYYTFIFISLYLLSATLLFSQCAKNSNIYTFYYNGKKYEIIKEKKNWADASACAVERGGYLAEINDKNEQAIIFKSIIKGAHISRTYTRVNDGGGTAYVWIGATDKTTEGKWMWDGKNNGYGINFWNGQGAAGSGGGSAVSGKYVNWGGSSKGSPNEPDNYGSNQNAAAMALDGWPIGTNLLGSAGEWNDININDSIYYVIEYDKPKEMK